MAAYERTLKQDATYWPATGNDGFGKKVVGLGVLIKCRWQDRSVVFISSDNKELTSSSIVYVSDSDSIANEGFLSLGDYSGQAVSAASGAKDIRQIAKSPSIDNRYSVVKVFL